MSVQTVMGRPVTGNIIPGPTRYEQWAGEGFLTLLDDILNQPGVTAVRWTQYTPYFADGDPCIFSVGSMEALRGEAPVKRDEDNYDEDIYAAAEEQDERYVSTYGLYEYTAGGNRVCANEADQALLNALEAAEEDLAHYEDFLLESFGDHAQITATTEGFDVASYEHD